MHISGYIYNFNTFSAISDGLFDNVHNFKKIYQLCIEIIATRAEYAVFQQTTPIGILQTLTLKHTGSEDITSS